jgi:hypothetical protein
MVAPGDHSALKLAVGERIALEAAFGRLADAFFLGTKLKFS